jgi:hypothetical protein
MAKRKEAPLAKPRRCAACKLVFVPTGKNPGNIKKQRFCSVPCKDDYHRHGGMNIERLQEVLERRLKKALLQDGVRPQETQKHSSIAIPQCRQRRYLPWIRPGRWKHQGTCIYRPIIFSCSRVSG